VAGSLKKNRRHTLIRSIKSLVILLSGAMLSSPAIVPAQTASLEICNNSRLEIDVAVAARIQYILTGYRWKSSGWYPVAAHSCQVVYAEDYDAAGLITPQSEALVAYTLVNSDGVWGAYKSPLKGGGGWIRHGTGEICVKQGEAFEFTRPAGDPAANCDGRKIPVSDEFLPDGPGKFTLTMDWEGDNFFVPLGKAVPSSNTPAKPPEDSIGMQLLKAIAKAAAEDRQKQDQAAAEERQRQAPAAEVQRQTELAAATPPPPPPAAPSSPPPGPPDDDPIGGGGFITPPSTFKSLLCVSADLVANNSWNQPEDGSKMAAFKEMAGRYIVSVAKPGWEYWITQGQFERFDPASALSGDQFVSALSPDSGKFDEFDPQCPSGYSAFWVQVSH
jgi:hypothetical protein